MHYLKVFRSSTAQFTDEYLDNEPAPLVADLDELIDDNCDGDDQ